MDLHWNEEKGRQEGRWKIRNEKGALDYHTKWSKSDRDRQIPYDITHVWNLKYETNKLIYKTERDPQK